LKFFGPLGGLRELFPKGGQEAGPPALGHWGGARAGRSGFYRRRDRGEYRGEPLVELIGRGSNWGEGTCQSLTLSVRLGQSTTCQRGLGLSLWGEGGWREIKIGAWSDPVEGREDESHEQKADKTSGLANARSMVLRLSVPVNGNRV